MENEQNIGITGQDAVKPPTRKTTLILRILGWIWAGLLALLLIAGIVVQAPWKVLILIVVFLIAAAILPRHSRKWFWRTVGAAVIALGIWIVLPTDYEGWEQYEYDLSDQLAKLEQGRAVAPGDNAAVDYSVLLEEDDADISAVDSFNAVFRGPWKNAEYPDAAAYVKQHARTVEKLIEISKVPECRFPLHNPSEEFSSARYATMRRWAYLLVIAANKDAGEGSPAEAVDKYAAVARMGRHLMQQGSGLDMLVAMAIKALAYSRVRPLILSGLDMDQLGQVEGAICAPDDDWDRTWTQMVEYDKLEAASEIAKYYEVNKNGRIRLSQDPYRAMRMMMRERIIAGANAEKGQAVKGEADTRLTEVEQRLDSEIHRFAHPSWSRTKLVKARTIIRWLYLPASPQEATVLLGNAFHERMYAANNMPKSEPSWRSFLRLLSRHQGVLELALRLDYLYQRMSELHMRLEADRRGTLLVVALVRYKNAQGKWPKALNDIKGLAPGETLVDPINGDSFVYELTGDSFTLYSRGQNGVDDGGKREKISFAAAEETLNKGCDDWLIWPPKKPRSAEEKDDK